MSQALRRGPGTGRGVKGRERNTKGNKDRFVNIAVTRPTELKVLVKKYCANAIPGCPTLICYVFVPQ